MNQNNEPNIINDDEQINKFDDTSSIRLSKKNYLNN